MKTPVIIPAFDEAEHIGSTLRALDAATTEPFVIVNGEQGARETLEVARTYVSHVYHRTEQGKFPAIQFALRTLAQYDDEAYDKPILFMDADTMPLRPKQWTRTLGSAVLGSTASAAAGLVFFHDGPIIDCALRNAHRFVEAAQSRRGYSLKPAYGANLAINFAGDMERLEEVLDAPHVWPAEDRYLAHLMAGEERRFTQTVRLGAAVLTSARSLVPLREKLGMREDERFDANVTRYGTRQADTVTHYFDEFAFVLRETSQIEP